MNTVIIIVTESGMMMDKNVLKTPEPSRYADSSSSSGMPLKNCLIRKMNRPFLKASPVAERIHSGQLVFSRLREVLFVRPMVPRNFIIPNPGRPMSKYLNFMNSESFNVGCGTTMVKMTMKNSILLPLNLNFAKPYPIMQHTNVWSTAHTKERINVFARALKYPFSVMMAL